MKHVTFVTGNQRKIKEAREACDPLGITMDHKQLNIHEIQHHDPFTITEHKVDEAFKILAVPVVVNDASWQIPALNGFPGGYMKDIAEWFTPEDFIYLLAQKSDRRIILRECIFYKDDSTAKRFYREFIGEIVAKPRGKTGNSLEKVVAFDSKTLAEHHDEGKMAFDAKDYIWHDFAAWYGNQYQEAA